MQKHLLKILTDPNGGGNTFRLYAKRLVRDGQVHSHVAHDTILDDDDVEEGILFNEDSGYAYPISHYVLSMLSDQDVDTHLYVGLFTALAEDCPDTLRERIDSNIRRLEKLEEDTEDGVWNRGEMEYYDKAVEDETTRRAFLDKIHTQPLWHIYLERKRYLTDKLDHPIPPGTRILELGCGNARTVSWILPPAENNYEYVGTDISFKRLILAKQVIPKGNFIQCSALNFPFKAGSFQAAIAFGVLHHLPDPVEGVRCTLEMLSEDAPFLIHEPIDKPSQFFSGGRMPWLRNFFETYEHSEHDNELDWVGTERMINERNITVSDLHFTVTVLRTVLARFLNMLPGLRQSRLLWQALIAADNTFAGIFCRKPNILGPGAVFAVLRR